MRYAIYFTPPQNDPLTGAAQTWLGRDAFDDAPVPQPLIDGLQQDFLFEQTAAPRRYGFHATIVAPFRLAEDRSEADLVESLDAFCGSQAPFDLPLSLGRIGNFLALVPAGPSARPEAFAAAAVEHFAPLRAPLTQAEIERRNPDRLTARQFSYLERWGYPYVMEEFRFHMTLTGSLPPDQIGKFEEILRDHFRDELRRPVEIGALSIFAEHASNAPFSVLETRPLRQTPDRKTA